MELYLDSADLKEIEEAFKLGFLDGLTTTPTFMHRGGVTDVDALIVKLSKMVPVLQIEALGNTAEEVVKEAHRQLKLGLDPKKTVFKIPVSLEGVRACRMLRNENLLVNVHLVYTLQQAYMAMKAGASYVCPLVGRLQDQGHDALDLVAQCVFAVDHYGYDSKIMFSSVRNAEHLRNAINVGVHTITVPWKIMKGLTDNNLTTLGTEQFIEHTRLVTMRVRDVISPVNPTVNINTGITEALVKMTEYGFGAITVVDNDGNVKGIFTDGDMRRALQKDGQETLKKRMSDFTYGAPLAVQQNDPLSAANDLFKQKHVDTILVLDGTKPVGMVDIQDLAQ
ncbi:MAG: transaldolase family protein [Cyclobacteriaceae bacterium]|jgi:TalC/MipB family fructose-6-phosphate aldolase|nr:transaldolase family protein [Cyclobacteriaceae bacterium]HQQ82898.1 transaldolase family protein [Cyclobacteriaceae bacterium]